MRHISWFPLLLLSVFLLVGCRASTPGATASASPTILPGKTIAPLPTSVTGKQADFSALHMFDAQNGWALVNNQMWRTTDGGLHWRNVTPKTAASAAPAYIFSTDFLTASLAWIGLSSPPDDSELNILETADGGQTWRVNALQVKGPVAEISFINPQDGWVCGDGGVAAGSSAYDLFRTTDGGASWVKAQDAQQIIKGAPGALPFGGDKNCPSFINVTTGWVTGSEPVDNLRYFYVTHDGGFHWQAQSLPAVPGASSQYSTLTPIFFRNDTQDGVLPVEVYASNTQMLFAAYLTHDGGASWQSTMLIPAGNTDFLDAQHGWVAQGGDLWVTGNGGQSWARLTPGGLFQNVAVLDFISAQEGWAAARDTFQPLVGQHTDNGVLLHTTNGGQTWTALNYSLV